MKKLMRKILAFTTAIMTACTLMPVYGGTAVYADDSTVSVWDGSSAAIWTSGSGTEEDPFIIGTAANMAYLAGVVNGTITKPDCMTYRTGAGQYFALGSDLKLDNWTPIGHGTYTTVYGGVIENSADKAFAGFFDGQGHNVEYTINSSDDFLGLFGYVGNSGNTSAAETYIKNLTVSGSISGGTTTTYCVGGIAAFCKNVDFIQCGSEVDITGTARFAGGIVGCANYGSYSGVSFTDCYNKGDIEAWGESFWDPAGGIAGYVNEALTMTNCYNLGKIYTQDNGTAGGLIGTYNADAQSVWTNCYSGKDAMVIFDTGYGGAAGGYLRNVTGTIYYCEDACSQAYGGGTVTGVNAYTDYAGLLNKLGSAYKIGTNADGAPSLQWEDNGHEHTPAADGVVTEPTCTENGYTTYVCASCGNEYIAERTEALGHNYILKESTAAACDRDGYDLYECSRCSDTYKDNEQKAFGHTYEDGKCITCGRAQDYTIATEADLISFAQAVARGENKCNAVLTADITLTGSWTPIGTVEYPFSGTFDGAGHEISGLSVIGSYACAGLFGCIENAQIRDLVVYGYINDSSWGAKAAGIAGRACGLNYFTNVGNNVIVIAKSDSTGYTGVGGIVGFVDEADSGVVLEGCYNKADIIGYKTYVGGLVGGSMYSTYYNESAGVSRVITMTDCYNTGSVEKTSEYQGYAGGLIGYCASVSLADSYNRGGVTSGFGELIGNYVEDDYDVYPAVAVSNCYGAADDFNAASLSADFRDKEGNDNPVLRWEKEGSVHAVLQSITVSGNYRTYYSTTDSFDPSGMVVTANYSDGTSVVVEDYTYSPAGNLSEDTAEVVISYDDHRTVSKAVTAAVSVNVSQLTRTVSFVCSNAYIYIGSITEKENVNDSNEIVSCVVKDKSRLYIQPRAYQGFTIDSVVVIDSTGTSPVVTYYQDTGIYVIESVKDNLTVIVSTSGQDTTFDGEGSGTQEDPYQISDQDDLERLAQAVNSGKNFYNTYFEQTADIELTGKWTPIGTGEYYDKSCAFMGIYDGGQHLITGLNVDTDNVRDGYGYGLFGNVSQAVIRNLSVYGKNTNISTDSSSAGSLSFFGGIVGTAEGLTLEQCASHVDVSDVFYWAHLTTEKVRESYTGGLVGYSSGSLTINNCYADGKIVSQNVNEYYYEDINTYVGGILGGHYLYSDSNSGINNSFFAGTLVFSNENTAGTAAGYNQTYKINGYYYPSDIGEVALAEGTALSAYSFYTLSSTLNTAAGSNLFRAGTAGHPIFTWENDAEEGKTITSPDISWYDSQKDSFVLEDLADLLGFAQVVNDGNSFDGKTVELSCDISITDDTQWTPVGTAIYPFTGTFDGNGHTVTLANAEDGGIFGYIEDAVVEYLVSAGKVSGGTTAGGIVGYALDSQIKYCGNEALVTAAYSGNVYAGGVAAHTVDCTIMDCFNHGTVKAQGNYGYAGGIAGRCAVQEAEAGLSSCYNTGAVVASDYAGGIAGYDASETISYCYSTGEITALSSNTTGCYAGAIAGSMNEYYLQDGFNYYLEGSAAAATGLGDEYGYVTCASEAELKSSEMVSILGNAYDMSSDMNDGFPYLKWELDPDFVDEVITEINNAADLYRFMNSVNGGISYAGITVTLNADVDLQGTIDAEAGTAANIWTPIGSVTGTVFAGTFDGQGYSISNMVIVNNNSGYEGLFAALPEEGIIKNVSVNGTIIGTNVYPGGIVGWNLGTVSGCTSDVDITIGGQDTLYAGGIAADNNGIIRDCVNNGNITSSGTSDYVGGITGHLEPAYSSETGEAATTALVSGCTNNGDITGYKYVGGIVGGAFNELGDTPEVSGCTNKGTVSGVTYSGSIMGYPECSEAESAEESLIITAGHNRIALTFAQVEEKAVTDTVSYSYTKGSAGTSYGIATEYIPAGTLLDIASVDAADCSSVTFTASDQASYTVSVGDLKDVILAVRSYQSSDESSVTADKADTLYAYRLIYTGSDAEKSFSSVRMITTVSIELNEDEGKEAEGISLNLTEADIATGKTLQLEAFIIPENSEAQTQITWTSSDEKIASVDENGLVTALRYGTAVITASTDNGLSAECTVQTRYWDAAGTASKAEAAEDKPYQYFFTPVYWAADNGITKGYDNVYFGVGQECTREDFVLFLYRMAGKPSVKAGKADVFTDVASSELGSSFRKAIAWAVEQGITKGYTSDDGTKTFGVGTTIARKDAIIMLYRYAGKPSVSKKTTGFTDVDGTYKTSSDTFRAIVWAKTVGITKGLSESQAAEAGLDYPAFGCNVSCTREQMITFIYRLSTLNY